MGGIVAAIRGGPDSRATIDAAIALAKDRGVSLHFLYVVNLDFLTYTSSTRVHTISDQMHQMGEFILLAAQDAAAAEGVEAEGLVRHGGVGDEIERLCHELRADYLILGQPQLRRGENVFTQDLLARFVERMEQRTGAKVIVAGGEPS